MRHPWLLPTLALLAGCSATPATADKGLARALTFSEVTIGGEASPLGDFGLHGIDIDSEVRVRVDPQELARLLPAPQLDQATTRALTAKIAAQRKLLEQLIELGKAQEKALEAHRAGLKAQRVSRAWAQELDAAQDAVIDRLVRIDKTIPAQLWLGPRAAALLPSVLERLKGRALTRLREGRTLKNAAEIDAARYGFLRLYALGVVPNDIPKQPKLEPELLRFALTLFSAEEVRQHIVREALKRLLKADPTPQLVAAVEKPSALQNALRPVRRKALQDPLAAIEKALGSKRVHKALVAALQAEGRANPATSATELVGHLQTVASDYLPARLLNEQLAPFLLPQLASAKPDPAKDEELAKLLARADEVQQRQPADPKAEQLQADQALRQGDRDLRKLSKADLGVTLAPGAWFGEVNLEQLHAQVQAQTQGLEGQLEALEQAGGLQDYSFTLKATLVRGGAEVSLVPVPGYSTFEGEGRTTTSRVIVDDRLKSSAGLQAALAEMKKQAEAQAEAVERWKALFEKSDEALKEGKSLLESLLAQLRAADPAKWNITRADLDLIIAAGGDLKRALEQTREGAAEAIRAGKAKLVEAAQKLPKTAPVTRELIQGLGDLIEQALAGKAQAGATKELARATAKQLGDHTIVRRADQTPDATIRVPNVARLPGDVVRVRVALFKGKKETKDNLVDVHVSEFLLERVGPWLQISPVAHLVDRQGRGANPNTTDRKQLQPTAGVAAVFHPYHCRTSGPGTRFWNFLELGIAGGVHLLDFEDGNDIEVGVSIGLSAFGDVISAGYGWNASVSEDRGYLYFGFGFGTLIQNLYKTINGPSTGSGN